MKFNQKFIQSIIPNVRFLGKVLEKEVADLSIDSRTVQSSQIFVALKGQSHDGHDFIQEAINRGASGLLLEEGKCEVIKKLDASVQQSISIIIVPHVYDALIEFAKAWRKTLSCQVVGITGSIGKTSTKEILANILKASSTSFVASRGNENTILGTCLNILRVRPDHKVAVFEMGVSKRGEMATMASLVKPTIGVITCVAHSHMEGLGSLSDIAHEKRDIFKYFKEDNIGVVNGDQQILANIAYTHPTVKFGSKTTNQIQARKIQPSGVHTEFILKLYKQKYKVMLNTNNTSRVTNTLAAASVAYLLNISNEAIIKGIQEDLYVPGRFEHKELKDHKGLLIDDCYNANPESMKAALAAFEKIESKGQKIAVLGDMLELGVNSPFWHRQIGRFLRKVPSLNHVILVGDLVKWTKATLPVNLSYELVENWQQARDSVEKKLTKEAVILVKASLGVKLGNIVKELT